MTISYDTPMSTKPSLERFTSVSPYRDPVDRKKLRFIFDTIVSHAAALGQSTDDLEVLEIGCGVGGITLPLATLGGRVRALDLDEADISEMRERAGEAGLHNIVSTREDALSFVDGRLYDVVVASEVFEHVTEPDRLAENCARHLKPGGLLIVTTPNGYGPWEMVNSVKLMPRRWGWLRKLAGKQPHDGHGREHEQRYTRARLLEIFSTHGLRLDRFKKSDFVLTLSPKLRAGSTSGRIDCLLAEVVPHWAASGWYLALRREESSE